MKITVIGTGYVGLVTGICLAEVGNDVLCLDVDVNKINILKQGGIPIYEPGLKDMVKRNVAAGRLRFTTDVAESTRHGAIQFIAVGTPPDEDGSADLRYVVAAARAIGQNMQEYKVIVDKSTVPVGTADKVRAAVQEELNKRGIQTLPRPQAGQAATCQLAGVDVRLVVSSEGWGEGGVIRELAEVIAGIVGYAGKFIQDTSKLDGTMRNVLDVSKIQGLGWQAKTSLTDGIFRAYEDYMLGIAE